MTGEFRFKRKLGQNFLRDKNLLNAIVADAQIAEGDEVLEIGAGMGTLTEAIAKKAKRVVSYEIDGELKESLLSKDLKNVEFRFKDALKTPIGEILSDFIGNFKLVANLPYYITTPLIFKFLEETDRLKSLTVMVQKEVAERIIAGPKKEGYGILSVMAAFYGQVKLTRIVKRNMFRPMPDIDSAVVNLQIIPREGIDKLGFSRFVRTAFAMKRKTLVNNLAIGHSLCKEDILGKMGGFDGNIRAEDLTVEELLKIYQTFQGDIGKRT